MKADRSPGEARPATKLVTLTWAELLQAAYGGVHRRIRRLRKGSQPRYGYDGTDPWGQDIESVAAEMAAAKWRGSYYADSGKLDYSGDIDVGVQVRHTARPDGRLIAHREDDDSHLFILVRGTAPTFEIVGQILGAAAKRVEWWTDPGTGRPAFFVPDHALSEVPRRG